MVVSFTSNHCAIQDRILRILVGTGGQKNGLYYFKEIEPIKIN